MAQAIEVFTPTTPAHLTFVERASLNDQLVDALETPGKQVVVYGPSGSGKTTLLDNKLKQIYENHVVTRCTSASTFESIVLSGFDKLNPFYLGEASRSRTTKIGASLLAEYSTIKSSITAEWTKEERLSLRRALPLQLTPERLAEFLGVAHCSWVIEDFHKVPNKEKSKLAQVLKTFMDAAGDYPELRIVAIGAVDTARQVVEYDREMSNRVAEILVPLMERRELIEIMAKGESLLNLKLGTQVKEQIAVYSSGLASVCHQLCLNICQAAGVREPAPATVQVSTSNLQEAISRYLADSSDTLKAVWDSALKARRSRRYDNCRLILGALVRLPDEGGTHAKILAEIREREPEYPSANVTTYLRELCGHDRADILRFDPYSNRYSFSNPLYRAYGLLRLRQPKAVIRDLPNFEKLLVEVAEKVFRGIRGQELTHRSK